MSPLQVAKPIVLDLMAAIAFAASFFIAKNGFHVSGLHSVYIAAGTGVGIGLVQLGLKKLAREPVGPLHWLSLGVVTALGAMTVLFHNELYIKLKPSFIDGAVGLFMVLNDWMTPYLPDDARKNIPRRTVFLAEKLWAAIMIGFSLVNVAVALLFDFAVWAIYATFVPTGIIVALFFLQYAWFRRLTDRNAAKAASAP
ncbi:MAG TPA: septation protein IspZ [Rhizomicrobium sp.]|nr:septation protein IspZ [Rhizomicrobium sp.]